MSKTKDKNIKILIAAGLVSAVIMSPSFVLASSADGANENEVIIKSEIEPEPEDIIKVDGSGLKVEDKITIEPEDIIKVKNVGNVVEVKPEATPDVSVEKEVVVNKDNNDVEKPSVNIQEDNTLPQTGSEEGPLTGSFGMLLIGLGAVLGFTRKKK